MSTRDLAEHLRRLSALVIALSLALPQRSCVNGGVPEIHYPLSNLDSPWSMLLIAALFTLPLLVLLLAYVLPRLRLAALLLGVAVAGIGLYWVSYAAWVVGTTMLAGWYSYTAGAVVYLVASLFLLKNSPSLSRVPPQP